MIQAVSLPAHAQTSAPTLGDGPWATFSQVRLGAATDGRGLAGRITDFLVNPAAAGQQFEPQPCSYLICISRTGNGDELLIRLAFPFMSGISPETVNPSDAFAFQNVVFSDNNGHQWNVNGSYDADADEWSGWLEGPCVEDNIELEEIASRSSDNNVFTGEHIQVASATDRIRLALVDEPPISNTDWVAVRGECPLLQN